MQSENPILDQLAKLMTNAAGAAKSVRDEVGTMIKTQAERLVNDLDLVPREEFEAMKAMTHKLRKEVEFLNTRLAKLEANRSEVPDNQMAVIVAKLSDAEQDAVLAFLAALERTGAGELLAAIPREGAYDPIADGLHSIAAAIAGRPAASVDVRAGDTHVHMPEPAVVVNNEVVAQPGRMDLHATLHRAPLRRTVTQRDADGLAAEIVEREIEE